MINIAIVGHGFVGKAVEYGFTNDKVNISIFDPLYNTTVYDIKDRYDAVFVCVPTPMSDDGSIDATIINEVIHELAERVTCPIVLKSTVTPDIVKTYEMGIPNLVYNPEFLTERNYKMDFVHPDFHVFGGNIDLCKKVAELYENYSRCEPCEIHYCTAVEASYIKYGLNSFLAMKVIFFNEYYQLIKNSNVDYDTVISGMSLDSRMGMSHMQVPGHDGKFGVGGPCFPKDMAALYRFSANENTDLTLLRQAIKINQQIRNNNSISDRENEQSIKFDLEF